MKTFVLGLTLSVALAFSAFSSSADAQDASAQAGDAWPSVTDFAAPGPFAIQREANVGPNAAYDIVRPMQLGEEGRKHPIISWNNGTLYQIDRYQDLLDHWASHGFVVMGGHTNRTAGGAVHKAAIDWLVAENARAGSVDAYGQRQRRHAGQQSRRSGIRRRHHGVRRRTIRRRS